MSPLNPDAPQPASPKSGEASSSASLSTLSANEAKVLRIVIDESVRYQGQPLYEALLEMFKREGCAGATVSRAISGFGGRRIIHKDNLVDVIPQLPLIVEVVDQPDHLQKIRPQVEAMVEEGLIFVQEVEIWKYTYHPRLREVPAKATVEEAMTREVVKVQLTTPLAQIVQLLLDQASFKALPVVDTEQKVVGIITDGDLLTRGDVPHRLRLLETLDRASFQQLMEELHDNAKTAAEVMTRSVVTLHPETPLREAARLMVDRKLKRMPVVDRAGHLVGMLGRLDVLKQLARSAPQASGSPVMLEERSVPDQIRFARDIMVTEVPTLAPNTPVVEVLERLVSSPLRRLVVVDEDKHILGVITDADLVERISHHSRQGVLDFLAQSLGFKGSGSVSSEPGSDRRASARTADELMITKLVTIGPDAPVEEVAKLMVGRKVKFLPVQNSEGQLLGVVLRSNLLQAFTEKMERE
jgi:CBS domain-containing protein